MKIYTSIIMLLSLMGCSHDTDINNTSWIADQGNMTIVMSFKSPNVQIEIKEGDKSIGETTGVYSVVNDTIRIGDMNNYDKAVVKNDELIYIENGGITKFKKLKQ